MGSPSDLSHSRRTIWMKLLAGQAAGAGPRPPRPLPTPPRAHRLGLDGGCRRDERRGGRLPRRRPRPLPGPGRPLSLPRRGQGHLPKPNQPRATRTKFFVRIGIGTKPLNDAERARFVLQRWGPDGPGVRTRRIARPSLGCRQPALSTAVHTDGANCVDVRSRLGVVTVQALGESVRRVRRANPPRQRGGHPDQSLQRRRPQRSRGSGPP